MTNNNAVDIGGPPILVGIFIGCTNNYVPILVGGPTNKLLSAAINNCWKEGKEGILIAPTIDCSKKYCLCENASLQHFKLNY